MRDIKTWNQKTVKKGNKSIVLDTIKDSSPISRASIANATSLNKGTVSSLVNELLDEQLIYELGPGESSGGRRPVLLLFNETAGYSIGIDIGVNYLLGVLTDLNGNKIQEQFTKFTNLSYEEIQKILYKTIDKLISLAPPSHYGIIGIGIGVPGIVNNEGEIVLAPNLNWSNINLHDSLFDKYQIPIIIENEANAGAYGEKRFGTGTYFENIVYVSIGMGIGVGLILNNELYKGNDGFSGELGHMTIDIHGENCRCGSNGCWELYASEQALLKQAKKLGIELATEAELSVESLISLAENNDEKTLQLLNDIGQYIGIGIKNIFNIFNPEQVIIGNSISSLEQWITPSIHQKLINQILQPHQEELQLDFSTLRRHSTVLGMTAFTTEYFLENRL